MQGDIQSYLNTPGESGLRGRAQPVGQCWFVVFGCEFPYVAVVYAYV